MAKKKVEPVSDYEYWCGEIDAYEKKHREWADRAKKVIKRYKDERPKNEGTSSKFNILWSNVQTLRPAIYARDPIPRVERRFKRKDQPARVGATMVERALSYAIECSDFGRIMRQVVDDRLLPGRGTAWVRYVPTFETLTDDEQSDERSLKYEEAVPDYVHWEDFGHCLGRTWEEVSGVWRKNYLTRDELVDRFPDHGKRVPLDHKPEDKDEEKVHARQKKACIYEIWDKAERKVLWLSKNYESVLDERDDPLELAGFFPCPRPLFATTTNDGLIPAPDYSLYQDQADELDYVTGRIGKLVEALKVVGVYDSSADSLGRIFTEGIENRMISVKNWARFSEKGGLKGSIEFVPLGDIAAALLALYDARDRIKQTLYEITGMSDIIRGASDPDETATAQALKGQFATLRLSDAQKQVQEFARDLLRLMGDLIASRFDRQTLSLISGIELLGQEEKQQLGRIQQQQAAEQQRHQQSTQQAQQAGVQPPPPPPPLPPAVLERMELMRLPSWEEVESFLRDDEVRGYRIEIETDSTIATDENAEKEAAAEMLNAAGGYLQSIVPAVQAGLLTQKQGKELLLAGLRPYRFNRDLEEVMEESPDPQQPQDPRSPEQKAREGFEAQQAELKAKQEQVGVDIAGQNARKAKAEADGAEIEVSKKRVEYGRAEFGANKEVAQAQREMGRQDRDDSIKEASAIDKLLVDHVLGGKKIEQADKKLKAPNGGSRG